jgi:SAM-dependent methyltransferase
MDKRRSLGVDESRIDQDGFEKLAPFFELLHPGRQDDVAFYSRMVTPAVHRILDLGSATGVLTLPMEDRRRVFNGRRGYTVGLDTSPAMVALARRASAPILWVVGDMRRPPLNAAFDLITCGLNTVQHLLTDEDMLAMLSSVRRLLAHGGQFVFDLFNPMPSYLRPERNRAYVRTVAYNGITFDLLENTSYDQTTRILRLEWPLPASQGRAPRVAKFRMRQYTPQQMQLLLAAAGLVVAEVSGDFGGCPVDIAAPRQVYRCT